MQSQPAKRVNIVSLKLVKESSILYKERCVRSPEDGYQLLKQFLGEVDRKYFIVVCLDTKNQPTAINMCHIGSLNGETVTNYSGILAVVDNAKLVLNSSILNTDGTVTVGFNETLTAGPDADDLKLTVNGSILAATAYTVAPISAGADAGKYMVTAQGLEDNGADGNPAGGDDILYVDVNGNSAYDTGTDIIVTTGTVSAGAVSLKSAVFTSAKLGTVAAPNTGKDADNNFLKGDVVVKVK